MIDQDTFDRFEDAKKRALRHGIPLIEALDHRRLLWTPDREHSVRVAVLEELGRRLDLQSANKLLSFYFGKPDGSALDMLEAVKQWIDTVTARVADKTLEDL